MLNRTLALSLAAAVSVAAFATPVMAKELGGPWSKERFQVRVRAIDVIPDVNSSVNIGGEVDADYAVVPEVDLSYFFTENIAAELIAATSKHDLNYTGDVSLGDAWVLPPTLMLQYHFTPDNQFSPYVGAGLNYSIFYAEDAASGFTDLEVDNGVGYGLQAGADFWVNDHWGVNLDVKKLWLNVDAKLNNGAIRADVDMDPWIVGAGVSYRF
ncbi:MAG: OmpW family protein [Rhodospirillales bacterium]|nr:OmpW family protein [Alphaproteobacteria bacterium]MCB9977509.1 OmpW family protein [Rhodospirillales bacterium]